MNICSYVYFNRIHKVCQEELSKYIMTINDRKIACTHNTREQAISTYLSSI